MTTMSAISHYRGGTIDVVAPVAKKLKAAYLKHGIVYRLSRFETGPNRGDWLVVVQYDQAAHETLQAAIAQDAECQQAFAEIAKFANPKETLQDHDRSRSPWTTTRHFESRRSIQWATAAEFLSLRSSSRDEFTIPSVP
jgi:hypothetical protein